MKKFKDILVLGGGSISRRHIRNLQHLGLNKITCLKRKKDEEFAEEFNVRVITSLNDIEKADVVIVGTPTSLHIDGIRIAQSLGSAILMEKPLVYNADNIAEVKFLLNDFHQPFFIAFMLRYHPLVNKIKEILDSGELGLPFSARLSFGSYLPNWHPWEDYRTSYAARKSLGGGVINTISHELDLMQYLFGNPKSVYCQPANFNYLGIKVEEVAEAIFEYDSMIVTLHLDYLQKEYDRSVEILCENGKIRWNWHPNKIEVQKANKDMSSISLHGEFEVNDMYVNELEDFLNIIDNRTLSHPLDKNHALKNGILLSKMHISGNDGRKVLVK